ncbi:flagellar hook-length control protein FliK [Ruegeria atlantica]|uniref:flagellar hook-length control protein FliK n=1 Tax=Ruegeria atlantica TaxID=81569 RepID=UPI001481099F|nr:flagellar hook-length control protein FliK [Ruegeria atlantica]
MPNPLSVLMPSPGNTAKPDAARHGAHDAISSASFQNIMDQETDPQSAESETTDLEVQQPDAESELELVGVEGETLNTPDVPDDQPLAELRPVLPEPVQKQIAQTPLEKPFPPHPNMQTGIEKAAEAQPDATKNTAVYALESPAEHTELPAVQTLVVRSVPLQKSPDTMTAFQSSPNGTAIPSSRSSEVPELSPVFRPERDMRNTSAVPPVQNANPMTPDRVSTLVQMQLLASKQSDTQTEALTDSILEGASSVRESLSTSTTRDAAPAPQVTTATARTETARAVANQIATLVSARGQPGTIEVALNPEELGRVSIVLNGREDGLHMTILAERPETLDMMRRHLSVLETEFQNFGLGDLSIDLGTSSDAQHDDSETGESRNLSDSQPEPAPAAGPSIPKLGPDGRIDIRL